MIKLIKKIKSWLDRQERIRRTVRELDCLNDRDLGDIGISRCDILAIARKNGRI
jgi:uncharacterized protein YjiS (DUF1127 family)